jgi:hypothetical protein
MTTLTHDEASEYARELLRAHDNGGYCMPISVHYSWQNALRMLLAEVQTRENETERLKADIALWKGAAEKWKAVCDAHDIN